MMVQVITAFVLAVSGLFTIIGQLALTLLLTSALLLRWRRKLGGDGAEQMALIALIAAALAVFPYPSPVRVTLAVLFIAAQACLSYLTSGVAKLISPLWRSGDALPQIVGTYAHGSPAFARLIQRHPLLGFIGSWGIIIYECSFPILIWGPDWLLYVVLALGVFFHFSCAIFMGLNSFLWSFPSTYICIIAGVGLILSKA
jgi:hypothetical protein